MKARLEHEGGRQRRSLGTWQGGTAVRRTLDVFDLSMPIAYGDSTPCGSIARIAAWCCRAQSLDSGSEMM